MVVRNFFFASVSRDTMRTFGKTYTPSHIVFFCSLSVRASAHTGTHAYKHKAAAAHRMTPCVTKIEGGVSILISLYN